MYIEDTYIYTSTDVAKYLVVLANEEKIAINMTKVQKLLYIVYGIYLRVYKRRLVNEHPQAWPYGPVFPTTRNRLSSEVLIDISESDISGNVLSEVKKDAELDKVLKFVFKHFGTWNATQLSDWSHQKNSPWDKTVNLDGFKWGNVIPDDLILRYFAELITVKEKDKEE